METNVKHKYPERLLKNLSHVSTNITTLDFFYKLTRFHQHSVYFRPKVKYFTLCHDLHFMKTTSKNKRHSPRTPLTPLRSLSSMNKDRYSGDFELRLMKYSKSDDIICLNSLSLLKDSCRKWSKRSFRSRRL